MTGAKDDELFGTFDGKPSPIEVVRPGIVGGTWEILVRIPSGLWPSGTYTLKLHYGTEATTLDAATSAVARIWVK